MVAFHHHSHPRHFFLFFFVSFSFCFVGIFIGLALSEVLIFSGLSVSIGSLVALSSFSFFIVRCFV
eukprot:UN01357